MATIDFFDYLKQVHYLETRLLEEGYSNLKINVDANQVRTFTIDKGNISVVFDVVPGYVEYLGTRYDLDLVGIDRLIGAINGSFDTDI